MHYFTYPFEATIDTTLMQKTIIAYRTSNHKLDIEPGRWLTILISRDKKLCQFYYENGIENEAHFLLECPS